MVGIYGKEKIRTFPKLAEAEPEAKGVTGPETWPAPQAQLGRWILLSPLSPHSSDHHHSLTKLPQGFLLNPPLTPISSPECFQ